MVTVQQYLEAIEKTHEVYNQVDETTHPAWKVIVGFYLALQIVDAHLLKGQNMKPKRHGSMTPPRRRAPDPEARNDLVWLYHHNIYVKYVAFYKLSRKARYHPEYYHPITGDPISQVVGWLTNTFLPMKAGL